MPLVIGPLALVGVPVRIGISAPALSLIVEPVPFVFRAVGVEECSLAVLLTVQPVAHISSSVFEPESLSHISSYISLVSIKLVKLYICLLFFLKIL